MLKFWSFKFEFEFEKDKIESLNLSLKSSKGTKPKLLIIKKWMKLDKLIMNVNHCYCNTSLRQCPKLDASVSLNIYKLYLQVVIYLSNRPKWSSWWQAQWWPLSAKADQILIFLAQSNKLAKTRNLRQTKTSKLGFLFKIRQLGHLCWVSFMLSVIYAECHLCWM